MCERAWNIKIINDYIKKLQSYVIINILNNKVKN